VTSGQIDLADVTARLLFPTTQQGPWLPFERFADTVATSRKKAGRHSHESSQVLVYILEGFVNHEDPAGNRATLTGGGALLLSAAEETEHDLWMEKGRTARWISTVIRMPPGAVTGTPAVQIAQATGTPASAEGALETAIVGPNGPLRSTLGLEAARFDFEDEGTCFCRIGGERRAVAYVVAGAVTVDTHRVEAGNGVLAENVSGLALHGGPGSRVFLATAPRIGESRG